MYSPLSHGDYSSIADFKMLLFLLLEKFVMLKCLTNQGSHIINNVFNNLICLSLYSEQSCSVSPSK